MFLIDRKHQNKKLLAKVGKTAKTVRMWVDLKILQIIVQNESASHRYKIKFLFQTFYSHFLNSSAPNQMFFLCKIWFKRALTSIEVVNGLRVMIDIFGGGGLVVILGCLGLTLFVSRYQDGTKGGC